MESVLRKIDECLDCENPMELFLRRYEQMRRNPIIMQQIHETDSKKLENREGYVKIRKVKHF